jgi:hypothetical protein
MADKRAPEYKEADRRTGERSRVSWAERTIGRDELSDAAHNASGVSANQAKAIVNEVVEEIAATLERILCSGFDFLNKRTAHGDDR